MTRRRSSLIALSLAVVVIIGLLVVGFVVVRRPSTTYGSPPLTAKEAAHAATEAQARLIPLGSTRTSVEAALGRSPEILGPEFGGGSDRSVVPLLQRREGALRLHIELCFNRESHLAHGRHEADEDNCLLTPGWGDTCGTFGLGQNRFLLGKEQNLWLPCAHSQSPKKSLVERETGTANQLHRLARSELYVNDVALFPARPGCAYVHPVLAWRHREFGLGAKSRLSHTHLVNHHAKLRSQPEGSVALKPYLCRS